MISIREEIFVRGVISQIFGYVSNFANMDQWDPGVLLSRKITPGPIRPGTLFHMQCSFLGFAYTMKYRVTELVPPKHVVLVGHGDTFTATDTITFHETQRGARIEYSLKMEFTKGGFFTERILPFLLGRACKKSAKGLARAFKGSRPLPEMRPMDRWMDKTILPSLSSFGRHGYIFRKKKWHPLTESLEGRTVIITGATSGLGKYTAFELARMGAKTVLVGRDREKVDSVCDEIQMETGSSKVRGEVADLGLKSEIRSLAGRLDKGERHIHVLINNAGALFNNREETREGVERSLAINLMSPFMLTTLLMPKLLSSAPSRIINVSSGGMYTQPIKPFDLAYELEPYSGDKAYARAKRGLVILTKMWAKKYSSNNIAVNAMHPGWVKTPGIEKSLPRFARLTISILRSPKQGADTIIWLAAAREAALASGQLWFDRRPRAIHAFPGTRESAGDRAGLIENLQALTGVKTR